MTTRTLFSFFRSGTSHRLRIALRLKGLSYRYEAIDLRTDRHLQLAYRAINPQGLVPALRADDDHEERILIQSPAIIEWLDERYPEPPLLPPDLADRARVRALSALVGCDVHPLNNRRVLEALRKDFGASETQVQAWCERWIVAGFDAFETLLSSDAPRGKFCFGSTPTVADVYLIPQVESARRFQIDVHRWPRIAAIDAACSQLEAFRAAAPAVQPDAT